MKKIKLVALALGLCAAVSLFAGCNNTSDESAVVSRIDGGQTKITVNNGGSKSGPAGAYSFLYKGYEIMPGTPAAPVIQMLGEPLDSFEGASCAGQGLDIIYSYPGFKLYAYQEDGEELVDGIEIEDPLIDCKGIHVGQTVTDAKAVFGTPDQEDDYGVIYRSEDTVLQINSNEVGEIISIMFRRSDD